MIRPRMLQGDPDVDISKAPNRFIYNFQITIRNGRMTEVVNLCYDMQSQWHQPEIKNTYR